ncbi:MAG: response regulator transcription factor [Planctomycetes bacterium]|nr:response regulator transcription factor [Planctomycetota bacterium]
MTRPRILVVEDDATLRDGLREALRGQGFEVTTATDGHEGRRALDAGSADLVILDLMLPGPGGLELLRAFRDRDARTPVIILTARGDETDKVVGLELGADDYVTKPFGLRELLARVRAHLRRAAADRDARAVEPFSLGGVTVDLASFRVVRDGTELALSPKEAGILALLFAEKGRAVHRSEILDVVWGRSAYVTHRTIDTHVLNLRNKVEDDPKAPRHVLTVHGVGYRLVLDASTGP